MLNFTVQFPSGFKGADALQHVISEFGDTKLSLFTAGTVACGVVLVWMVVEFVYKHILTCFASTPMKAARKALSCVRKYSYDDTKFFAADGAPSKVAKKRSNALLKLSSKFKTMFKKSIQVEQSSNMNDMRFMDINRVPFQFQKKIRETLRVATVVKASKGAKIIDVDDNECIDISGSYGVNVCGYERYKEMIANGLKKVQDLGPVLGPIHSIVAENVEMLKDISGMDEVSFHMSGTEAVMSAVRSVRFNTQRKFIVQFKGAYHGWWDGVQPGPGNSRDVGDVFTFQEMKGLSLSAISARSSEIAGVLISPFQAFAPNAPPPNDMTLINNTMRKAPSSASDYLRSEYKKWLIKLRKVCTDNDIPLIFDEVYSGFRMAPGGAQEFFGVKADMVVYGKTLGGGMPNGVVCGKTKLMKRIDEKSLNLSYVIGTFSACPYVMGPMNEFLKWNASEECREQHLESQELMNNFVNTLNAALNERGYPISVVNLSTVFTIKFLKPGRYHWMFQYYMRAEGIALSWVGTGRCLVSLDFTEELFEELQEKMLSACQSMVDGGWWDHPVSNMASVAKEMAWNSVFQPLVDFYEAIMEQKHIDHHASHSNLINQFLHLISSSIFIWCYYMAGVNIFGSYQIIMYWALSSLFVRQAGHYIFEPPCHDKEQLMMGFDTAKKVKIVIAYSLLPLALLAKGTLRSYGVDFAMTVADLWVIFSFAVVFGRVIYLWRRYRFSIGMHWWIKFMTDPFTDIPAYWRSIYQIFNVTLVLDALTMSFPSMFPNRKVSKMKVKSGYD